MSKVQALSKFFSTKLFKESEKDAKGKSKLKVVKKKKEKKKTGKGKQRSFGARLDFPTMLAFEPLQLCNALCFCCPYSWLQKDKDYRTQKMSREQIQTLLDDFGSIREKFDYDGELRVNPFRYSDPLICKDLDLILELCEKYRIKCAITTNGISFHSKNTELLARYFDAIGKISISVIGTNAEEIKKLMNVDLDRTFETLRKAVEQQPILRRKIRVNLRKMTGNREELQDLIDLQNRFYDFLGRKPVIHEPDWLTNRVNANEFSNVQCQQPDKLQPVDQSSERFVNGCPKNIHERIEVMVNGDVVLCCDDAERNKVFGNVFESGIIDAWHAALKKEHETIFSRSYLPEKNDLICGTCSRAKWSNK